MMRVTKQFEHLKIQLESIISATNNFADENCVGKGGFGKVYKGELVYSKGQTVVAIKRLNRAFGQGDPEFWKEIIMLSRYKHENIVSLLGFCDDSGEKILVYEYASNKSLDLHLNSNDLTWIQRLKICIGAARGLAYLHDHGRTQQRILHRDIKSSNILLDETWNARISDFGLSKFAPANQQISFMISNGVGTIGYCDPVYVETGLLTKESDVYSFGVVLFEVLCGRLCIGVNNDKRPPLTGLARQCYKQNNLNEIIYGNIRDEINSDSLKAFSTIAYQCLKRDIEKRPLMAEVVRVLESALEHQTDHQRNNGGNVPFFVGMIKKSFRDRELSKSTQHVDHGTVNVTVNGHPIPDRLVKKAEELAGPIQPGEYWYDARAGFWGMMGGPCRGITLPFIKELSYPMPEKCADGNTNVFVNGRELHQRDLDLLSSRGLPTDTDRSYTVDISGRVLDEDLGEELECLGKLAPTLERKKHGFGMKPPRRATGV